MNFLPKRPRWGDKGDMGKESTPIGVLQVKNLESPILGQPARVATLPPRPLSSPGGTAWETRAHVKS